ncbi:MAG: hypothetical protein N2327_08230 [Caldimicrobium sp.]|nr:hypothetical protein [Caldimicrobium sp.]MCX7874395.1 hypothetical protein [Caldimicrobium sp.]
MKFLSEAEKVGISIEQAFCNKPQGCYTAKVKSPGDLSFFLPYLRVKVRVIFFNPEECLVFKWYFEEKYYKVSIGKDSFTWGIVNDIREAQRVWFKLSAFLREVLLSLDEIEPFLRAIVAIVEN